MNSPSISEFLSTFAIEGVESRTNAFRLFQCAHEAQFALETGASFRGPLFVIEGPTASGKSFMARATSPKPCELDYEKLTLRRLDLSLAHSVLIVNCYQQWGGLGQHKERPTEPSAKQIEMEAILCRFLDAHSWSLEKRSGMVTVNLATLVVMIVHRGFELPPEFARRALFIKLGGRSERLGDGNRCHPNPRRVEQQRLRMVFTDESPGVRACAYCGMAYPEGTPSHGTQVLTDHIKVCDKHPMRALERDYKIVRAALVDVVGESDPKILAEIKENVLMTPDNSEDRRVSLAALDALIATSPTPAAA